MASFQERIIRAARLDAQIYEEVEADQTALPQAVGVVVLASVAAGIAALPELGLGGLIGGAIGALISWFIWAGLTYLIGTRLLPEPQTQADLGQLLRTIGFASSPGLIQIIGVIPPLRGLVTAVAQIWMLVAMVVAVRQALDYRGTGRAIAVCAIGWVVQAVIIVFLLGLAGGGAG